MNFFDSSAVVLVSGLRALGMGFVMYFVVRWACRSLLLDGFWRLGLTLAAVFMVAIPDAWELLVYVDPVRSLSEKAYSPEGLALAIKTKLLVGVIGHLAGFVVQEKVLES